LTRQDAGEPGGDAPVLARLDAEQDHPTVGQGAGRSDQAGASKQVQLATRRRAIQPDLESQARWSSRPQGEGGDDPAPRPIRQQLDPVTIPWARRSRAP
jgi:hypothetical protein